MKIYSKTLLVLLLSGLLGACGTVQVKEEQAASTTPQLTEEQKRQIEEEAALTRRDYDLALTTMRQGNYLLAINQFMTFNTTHPGHSGAYVNLGILYHKTNQLELAEKALRQAVELNPKQPKAQNLLGMVYRELGRFNDALTAYNSAIAADENYADAYLNLGILYDLYLLDGKKALQFYSQYQKLTGNTDAQVSLWVKELKLRTEQVSQAGSAE